MKAAKPKPTPAPISLPAATRRRLDRSARETGRSASAIAAEAITDYLAWRGPQQAALKLAIIDADRGDFADPKDVKAVFDKYARR